MQVTRHIAIGGSGKPKPRDSVVSFAKTAPCVRRRNCRRVKNDRAVLLYLVVVGGNELQEHRLYSRIVGVVGLGRAIYSKDVSHDLFVFAGEGKINRWLSALRIVQNLVLLHLFVSNRVNRLYPKVNGNAAVLFKTSVRYGSVRAGARRNATD